MRQFALILAIGLVCTAKLSAADWLTDGHDPQRSGWQKDESALTVDNVKGLKLLWKVQTDSKPGPETGGFGIGRNLHPPLIAENVSTPVGQKEIALIGTG